VFSHQNHILFSDAPDSGIFISYGGRQVIGKWERQEQIPIKTPLSDTINRELKHMGFKFVGSTIIYSWLQSVGVVNDHIPACGFIGYDFEPALEDKN
jgi:DNA-3-methyladenine glycosylase I